jgi:hypothetical protein
MTYIYYLHNGDNIPFYIGKTNYPKTRLSAHKKTFNSEIKLKIISKVNNWKKWEKYYIEKYKKLGYILENKNSGGGGSDKWSFESIQKLKSNLSRSKKISKSRLGKPMPHKDKKFTQEHKNKIKSTRSFLKNRSNTWSLQPVLQYDLEGNFIKEWPSQIEAAKFLNKTGDGIGACCRGRQKKAYSYIWKFKN